MENTGKRVLILESQSLVASDLAEGLAQIAPIMHIEIRQTLHDATQHTPEGTRFHIAFIAAKLVHDPASPALLWAEERAERIIIMGDQPTMEGANALPHERLTWPISDAALARVIARITCGA